MPEGREGGTPPIEIKITAKATKVHEAVNLPDDPNLLDLLGKWADAWGERTWTEKTGNVDAGDEKLQPYLDKEEEVADQLETALKDGGYKDVRFRDGVVLFDDGHVQLSH